MSLPQDKRLFLKNLAYGLDAFSEHATRIGKNPEGPVEAFIKKNILNPENDGSYTFSKGKFMMSLAILDFDTLSEMLIHLDTLGVTLGGLYKNTLLNTLVLSKKERDFCKLIIDEDLSLFKDLILY